MDFPNTIWPGQKAVVLFDFPDPTFVLTSRYALSGASLSCLDLGSAHRQLHTWSAQHRSTISAGRGNSWIAQATRLDARKRPTVALMLYLHFERIQTFVNHFFVHKEVWWRFADYGEFTMVHTIFAFFCCEFWIQPVQQTILKKDWISSSVCNVNIVFWQSRRLRNFHLVWKLNFQAQGTNAIVCF